MPFPSLPQFCGSPSAFETANLHLGQEVAACLEDGTWILAVVVKLERDRTIVEDIIEDTNGLLP